LKRIYFIPVLLLLSNDIIGQPDTSYHSSFFKKRDFGQYFLSDHFAPIFKLGIGASATGLEYDINASVRVQKGGFIFSEPVLGTQIPIYYFKSNNHKFSVSIPVSFSVWFDFTETRTAPIINTDYRFALSEMEA
jgi:hypothetical protein